MIKVSVAVFRDSSAKAEVIGTGGVEQEESQGVLQFLQCNATMCVATLCYAV